MLERRLRREEDMGKNQHYVPRFLLKKFSEDQKTIKLFNFKNNEIILNAPIKHQSSLDYIYGKDQVLEKALQDLEDNMALIVKEMDTNPNTILNQNQRNYLQTFIQFQLSRTPRSARYMDETLEKSMKILFKDDKVVGKNIDTLQVSYINPYHQSLKISIDTQGIFSDLKIGQLQAPENTEFVLGQNPAFLVNPYYHYMKWKDHGLGYALKGICIFLPISPNKTIVLYDRNRCAFINQKKCITISPDDLYLINKFQFAYSDDCIYFKKEFSKNYLEELSKQTSSCRLQELSAASEIEFNGQKGVYITESYPPINPVFSFLAFKEHALTEKYPTSKAEAVRESILPVIIQLEKGRGK
jgi:hypothetical protein